MTNRTLLPILGIVSLLSALPIEGGPITTVPWNGYPGAITFSFDDGAPTQLTNAIPVLDARNVKGTFFVIGDADFTGNEAGWILAARNGHEVANHTLHHVDMSSMTSAQLDTEIAGWADSLRRVNSAIRCLTLGYPYCTTSPTIDAAVNKSAFIARTCGGNNPNRLSAQEPDWMTIQSNMVNAGYQSLFDGSIDAVAGDTGWLVLLMHGIGGDWNVNPTSDLVEYVDRAISHNLWVSTFETIGAYWRASFTMNRTSPSTSADGWTVSWTSPHPMMPPSVPLRIKLDKTYFGTTVSVFQNGTKISPQGDGSYIIDFMKLQMTVQRGSTGVAGISSAKSQRLAANSGSAVQLFSRAGGNRLVIARSSGLSANDIKLYNVNGILLGRISARR